MRTKQNILFALLRPLVVAFLKITFGYTFDKAKDLPNNYIVLSNHTTDFDPLLVAASFRKPMYFVASEHIARWPVAGKLLTWLLNPIYRKKGA